MCCYSYCNADAAHIPVLLTNAVPVNADAAYFHVLLTRAVAFNADADNFHVLLTCAVAVNADAVLRFSRKIKFHLNPHFADISNGADKEVNTGLRNLSQRE